MLTVVLAAALAGVLGFTAARSDAVELREPLASRVPEEKHDPFIADLWAHGASYGAGVVGGLVVVGFVWWRRYRVARAAREDPANDEHGREPRGATHAHVGAQLVGVGRGQAREGSCRSRGESWRSSGRSA